MRKLRKKIRKAQLLLNKSLDLIPSAVAGGSLHDASIDVCLGAFILMHLGLQERTRS